jgi:salicylate hydroxylase
MTVIIVGGGIGGLAVARGLSVEGIDDYIVLEQAPAITTVGAGIQITPNAARAIDYLGLTAELTKESVQSDGTSYYDMETNELLLHTPTNEAAGGRYGFNYSQVHRAWLLDVLKGSLDQSRLRLGSRCVSLTQEADAVVVELENGETIRGDVLIGADGLNSIVRKKFAPTDAAEFSGIIGCRTIIPAERARTLGLDRRQHTWWGSNGRRLITYWVGGGSGLNFLAMIPANDTDPETWKSQAEPENLREVFRGSCATITEMLEMVDDTFVTGIFDRPPLESIVDGRIALLGDAAHPLVPYLANGAAQALEDAVVFARCFARNRVSRPVEDTLLDYERRRLPRVTNVQRRSREMDSLSNIGDPDLIRERNAVLQEKMAADPSGGWFRDWLWGYDVVDAADSTVIQEPYGPDLNLERLLV